MHLSKLPEDLADEISLAWGHSKKLRISDLPANIQTKLRSHIGDANMEHLVHQEKQGKIKRATVEQRTCDGITFDSRGEMECYKVFRDVIGCHRFALQPKFVLQPGFYLEGLPRKVMAITYSADFLIGPRLVIPPKGFDTEDRDVLLPEHWVVDVKGMQTQQFVLREKMFMYRFRRTLITIPSGHGPGAIRRYEELARSYLDAHVQ